MEKRRKVVMFQSMVSLFILNKLGKSSEAKKNSIYLIKEKWLLNLDVVKLKLKPFKKLKKKFKNSRLQPKMVQFRTFRINVKKS